MAFVADLRDQGWFITSDGYNIISQNDTIKNKRMLITNALNTDIKEFGDAILIQELKQNKIGKIILQIQKIKNVSAPKANENSQAAPRMLKLTLTDGHTNCQAIEISHIQSFNVGSTPPGSKILIDCAIISSNYILLHPKCCTFLDGKVPSLFEKWELSKNLLQQRTGGMDGPPPWVNFGEKIITNISKNEPFKALITKEAKKDEFDIQRQDAINVATTGAVKKVFGGGTKNVALTEVKRTYEKHYKKRVPEKIEQQKAPDKVSLFNFLEDKLQVNSSVRDNDIQKVQKFDEYKPKYAQKKVVPSEDFIVNNFEKLAIDKQEVWNWKVGDLCMAKYWEDGKYYNATIVNLTERTCVVQFNGYGNVEEVLKVDCIPLQYDQKPRKHKPQNYKGFSNNYYNKKTFNN